jgi:hypothetical protein
MKTLIVKTLIVKTATVSAADRNRRIYNISRKARSTRPISPLANCESADLGSRLT